jgi:hypothetical protein
MKSKLTAVLTLLALGAISNAHAGLIGDTVTVRYLGDLGQDTGAIPVLVGPGSPDGNFFGTQLFDFGDDSFSIASSGFFTGIWASTGTVSLLLGSLDLGAPITGVTFVTTLSGVSMVFGADFVTFTWAEQSLRPETYLSGVFTTGAVSVPEPGTMALFGLALAALGLAIRRKQAPRA